MRLCIDMGSDQVKCAFFDGARREKVFRVHDLEELKSVVDKTPTGSINHARLVCSDLLRARTWVEQISSWGIPIKPILCDDFLSHVEPGLNDLLLPDTIAKIYGALSLYPMNDCLVIDFGTTARYELITKQGQLLGRATFPFFDLLYQSLHINPQHLEDQIPSPLGKNPIESINSGCYYGLLGSVERIIAEIRLASKNSLEIITIATGTLTEKLSWKNPLTELIDQIHPYLILEGLNQIMNEGIKK